MKKKTPIKTTEIADRIGWLMQKLWRGSQTAMAADLGVTQGTIGNVLARRRKPGRMLLAALASHPLVNESWLHNGLGSPLVMEATGAGSEAALPIAREPFGGFPEQHPEYLAEVLHPVPRRLYRPSRYWVHIDRDDHPLALAPSFAVQNGDWILMEPDQANWPKDLRGKHCLASVTIATAGTRFVYCQDVSAPDGTGSTLDFNFLGQLQEELDDTESLKHEGKELRYIDTGRISSPSGHSRKSSVTVVAIPIYRCGDL